MQAPWWWSKTEICRTDIYVYFHVNFNVIFEIKMCICWWVNSTKKQCNFYTGTLGAHLYTCFHLRQCLQDSFARRTLLASKHDHGSSHACSCKYKVSGRYVSKDKNLCLQTDFRYILMNKRSTRNNTLQDLTLIKMNVPRFLGTESFN